MYVRVYPSWRRKDKIIGILKSILSFLLSYLMCHLAQRFRTAHTCLIFIKNSVKDTLAAIFLAKNFHLLEKFLFLYVFSIFVVAFIKKLK